MDTTEPPHDCGLFWFLVFFLNEMDCSSGIQVCVCLVCVCVWGGGGGEGRIVVVVVCFFWAKTDHSLYIYILSSWYLEHCTPI